MGNIQFPGPIGGKSALLVYSWGITEEKKEKAFYLWINYYTGILVCTVLTKKLNHLHTMVCKLYLDGSIMNARGPKNEVLYSCLRNESIDTTRPRKIAASCLYVLHTYSYWHINSWYG